MFGGETIETSTFRALGTGERETDEHGRVLPTTPSASSTRTRRGAISPSTRCTTTPRSRNVLDYHDGVRDVRRRRLRIIGDPESRYREDPVRMLRAVRFAAKLGFEIDPDTREPIGRLAGLIENVPAARLFDEMLKLLTSGHSVGCIERLRAEGLHHGLLPLLDVILDQPQGERFIMLALSRTDERVRAGKHIAPGFLFATLLWNEVLAQWNARVAAGEHRLPALDMAIDRVLEQQTEKLAIQRRYSADMREIWMMQPRFERRHGQAPLRLLEHLRLRAGYDFLLLRCDCAEAPAELGHWWTQFLAADADARTRLTQQRNDSAPAARKRRRGGRRKTGTADAPGAAAAGGDDDGSS